MGDNTQEVGVLTGAIALPWVEHENKWLSLTYRSHTPNKPNTEPNMAKYVVKGQLSVASVPEAAVHKQGHLRFDGEEGVTSLLCPR
mmetsp:Transcript_42183/g.45795  ORF Transcript_42183/g.45795 Transcript_42183/m.45795 type:complete len:86 (-) Transcript_42183:272-529(-)